MGEQLELFAIAQSGDFRPSAGTPWTRADVWRDKIVNLWNYRGLDPEHKAHCLLVFGQAYCRERRAEALIIQNIKEAV